jgi:hypothetical protein
MLLSASFAYAADARPYISLNAFGWGTCSDVNGTPYNLDGGQRADNPKSIVLTASGGDDYQAIINAIKANDIIYLDVDIYLINEVFYIRLDDVFYSIVMPEILDNLNNSK